MSSYIIKIRLHLFLNTRQIPLLYDSFPEGTGTLFFYNLVVSF